MRDLDFRPFLMNQLMRPVTTGRIVHAQIFAGAEGTGKYTAARYVSQALNCTGSVTKPCGVCPSCLRFRDNNAPELIEISRRKDKSQIVVDQIADLMKEVYQRPDGKIKCVIIRDAELMNASSQNKLLKTLEEPPEYAAFFLLTRSCTALLPTIRSRCQLLRFSPMSNQQVEQSLLKKGIDAQLARRAAPLSFGSIGKALSISRDSSYMEDVDELASMFTVLKTKEDIPKILSRIGAFKGRARRMLEILEQSADELMLGKAVSPVACAMHENRIDGSKLMGAVVSCLKKLEANVTYQYAAEMLLLDLFSPFNL